MSHIDAIDIRTMSIYDMLLLSDKMGLLQQYLDQKNHTFSWNKAFSDDELQELSGSAEHQQLTNTLYDRFADKGK